MKLQRILTAPVERAGAALLLSFLVLIMLAAIVFQLYISTNTNARVARNDVAIATMDQVIESAMMEVYDRLITDAESAGEGGAASGGGGGALGAMEGGGGGGPGGEEEQDPSDSHEDSWGKPQRTMINELELRILVQDENSKLNVLGILTADEEEAEKHFERLVKVLDLCREETREDIDRADARRLAERIREHLTNRTTSILPKPMLLTDDENDTDRGLPMSIKEFGVLDDFDDGLFRDYRDERGDIVHSIASFLTIWSGVTTEEEFERLRAEAEAEENSVAAPPTPATPTANEGNAAGAPGSAASPPGAASAGGGTVGGAPEKAGVAVNINTAPAAVLKSLMDDRDVSWRFWDDVIEYRNLEEEDEDNSNDDPIFDETGEEIIKRQVFDSIDELDQVRDWSDVGPTVREELQQLIDTQSNVFTIFVTARRATGLQDSFGGTRGARGGDEREDLRGDALVRTVRSVVWRYKAGDDWIIVPLIRWEIIDYTPFEVLDYPDPYR